MTDKTVLITGGAGFIGSTLASRLCGEGVRVVAMDTLHPQVHPSRSWPATYPAEAEKHVLDVIDPASWDKVLSAVLPDHIVHLAAETGTGQSLTEASRHGRVNVVGTTEMLDALTRHNYLPKSIVLASSRAVYGEGRWVGRDGETTFYPSVRGAEQLRAGQWNPTDPETGHEGAAPLPHRARTVEPRPSSVYGATKLAQEHILSTWCKATGCPLAILRLQNVYGPGQSLTNPYTGIVTLFAQLGLKSAGAEIYEDGAVLRDFVFVDDVVRALRSAIELDGGTPYPLDIGSGTGTTLLELASAVANLTNSPAPHISGRSRPGDVRAAFADVTDAREILGYEPQVDLATGLSRLLAWITESA